MKPYQVIYLVAGVVVVWSCVVARMSHAHATDEYLFTQVYVRAQVIDVERKEKGTTVVLETEMIEQEKISARLSARIYGEMEIEVGDLVDVQCKIEPITSEVYAHYSATKKIFANCNSLKVLWRKETQSLRTLLAHLKQILTATITRRVPQPVAGLLVGMILGDEQLIPDEIHQAFVNTGTSHILAISGFNIALFTVWGMRIWPYLRIKRQYAAWIMLVLVIGFVMMVGAGASVVRAAMMGCVPLISPMIGRQSSAKHLLIVAGTVMILQNPYITLYDVGFQLSFVATAGMLWWATPLEKRLEKISTWIPASIIAPTLAAFVSTLPVTLIQFGRISPYSIILNILIALAVTQLTGLIILLMIFGSLPILGTMIASGATILGSFIISAVTFTASLPYATL